jgi:hypothetical protein
MTTERKRKTKFTRKPLGVRVAEEPLEKLREYALEHDLNFSEAVEAILCHFFYIEINTAAYRLVDKDREIDRLKPETHRA